MHLFANLLAGAFVGLCIGPLTFWLLWRHITTFRIQQLRMEKDQIHHDMNQMNAGAHKAILALEEQIHLKDSQIRLANDMRKVNTARLDNGECISSIDVSIWHDTSPPSSFKTA